MCRYGRKPVVDAHSECAECGTHDNLWMCLICGHVGCSRYGAGHAASHFRSSHHPYAMEVETQRVWDYIGDGYVHRLIASAADGKLVELPGADDAPADSERRTVASDEKVFGVKPAAVLRERADLTHCLRRAGQNRFRGPMLARDHGL